MSPERVGEITQWLQRIRAGDSQALDHLMPLIYDDLRQIARRQLRGERSGHTLSATALVNEAYMKLLRSEELDLGDRSQFFAVAAVTMQRLLVDYARARRRLKRGGGEASIPLHEVEAFLSEDVADEILALDDALARLSVANPRGSEVVKHRFFAGLTLEESADLLGVSRKTVQRDWTISLAWLRKEVGQLTEAEFVQQPVS